MRRFCARCGCGARWHFAKCLGTYHRGCLKACAAYVPKDAPAAPEGPP